MPHYNRVYDNALEAVGHTPLVRLGRYITGTPANVWAKVEFLNPMGSIKDRLARYLIDCAEADGRIKPGDTIIEASSGNTALGLAMVAILRGYKCKMLVRDSVAREKIGFLQALGVELIMVNHRLPREHPDSYNRIADRVAAETPNSYYPDQHNNRENNDAHYHSTAPEIWEQMEGKIDYFVAGIGTGGTLSGVARFLKEKDPKIQIIAVDPVGSVFHEWFRHRRLGASSRYHVEGLGDECVIGCVDFELIDDMIQVTDKDAFFAARELARTEALIGGGSSGAAVWAARTLANRVGRKCRIVTVLPDSGFRYGSAFYNDNWLTERGLI